MSKLLGAGILSSCSPRVSIHGTTGTVAARIRTLNVAWPRDHGWVTGLSSPSHSISRKKIVALDDPLRCLPVVMFCNSNEHSENEDWLKPAHCLETWCLTHFSIFSLSSRSMGVRCWHFSPLKMCLLSWMPGLSWGHFYQALSQSMVLLSPHCHKELGPQSGLVWQ